MTLQIKQQDIVTRCAAAAERCSAALCWNLDAATCQRYARALAVLLDEQIADERLQAALLNYHAEHATVAALSDARQAGHERAWQQWMAQVLAILRHERMDWSSDLAIDSEDLAQIARAELVRALPSYRYQSSLSVWAYRVVVQAVSRHIRDSRRAKRAARPDSLDQMLSSQAPLPAAAGAEAIVDARQLYGLVRAILGAQPDPRLLHIFHLWAIEERRVAEIGDLVRLHPSRVRALLAQTRQVLRAHPALQEWCAGDTALLIQL